MHPPSCQRHVSAKLCLLFAASLAGWTGACSDTTEPVERAEPRPPPPVAVADIIPAKSVVAHMDAYVRSGAANKNYGANDTLLIQKVGKSGATRILVAFPQAEIADSLGADSLVSASLELTIKRTGNDWGTSGRAVAAHRMTLAWTEGGTTWNCPNDLNVGNNKADCTGNTWSMTGSTPPFVATAVAQSVITNGQSGMVGFDVTSDVRAFLAGQAPNQGWLLKLAAESQTGTLVFHSRESATKPRLALTIYRRQSVPMEAPDLVPVWMYSDTNVAANGSASIATPFTKRIVVAQFHPGATLADREAAVSTVGGAVVGGVPIAGGEGHYYLRIEDVDGATLLAKASELRGMPQVSNAFVNVAGRAQWHRPNDGTGWLKAQWAVVAANLDPARQTWALTAINAPLAWGCDTGATSTPIAVVDLDFRVGTSPGFQDLQGMSRRTASSGIDNDGHGAAVAGILAAKGNNSVEMTGVIWAAADVRLYDYGILQPTPGTSGFASPIAAEVEHAVYDGAKVVNLSSGIVYGSNHPQGFGTLAEQQGRDEMHWALRGALQTQAARGRRPLVVLSAGNDGLDASWNAFPLVRDAFPNQVLTVGGTTSSGTFWWDRPGLASDTGRYVDLVAPAKDVFTFDGTGAIVRQEGTSLSAPLVSGIAGLLLSVDPDLTTAQVRQLILDGAARGNRKVTHNGRTYYLADAYQTLRLAAEKAGTSLCGNRVWAQDDTVYAQRGVTNQRLFSAGGPAAFLNVFHGGRRIDWADRDYAEHSAVLTGNGWGEVADRTALTDTAPGGTARSMGTQESGFWYSATHDRDKLIRARITYLSQSLTDVKVQTSTDDGVSWTTVHSFTEAGFDGTTFEYAHRRAEFDSTGTNFVRWINDSMATGASATASAEVRYYPSGAKALIDVRLQQSRNTLLTEFEKCPWASEINGVNTEECRSRRHESEDLETRLYELDLVTGFRTRVLTIPGWAVSGVSEDEEEIILAGLTRRSSNDEIPRTDGVPRYTFTNLSSSESNCHASWYARQDVSTPAFRVVGSNMCTLDHGAGTIAPLRRHQSGISSLNPGMRR